MKPASVLALALATPLTTALSVPSPWRNILARESSLSRRAKDTIPAAINVAPSQYWDGIDGPWSSFALQIGVQPQVVRTFISTAASATITVGEAGCPDFYPAGCADLRGGLYNSNYSGTWIANSVFNIGIEQSLGLDTNANSGYDTVQMGWKGSGGPLAQHMVVFNLVTSTYWLGLFGMNPRPTNFTNYQEPQVSFMQALINNDTIPSLSYGYTAGNQYRLSKVYGSLVLGGYDENRFAKTNVTFPFNADQSLDLSVNIHSIMTHGGNTNLLPDGSMSAFIDSSVAQLYLPASACAVFETAFGLTYDTDSGFYLVNSSLHTTLTTQNPSVTFTIGPQVSGGPTVDIVLPYGAFDLQVKFPNVQNPNTSYYFPLQRADNSSQYILGRTFLQEAYLIADYDRQNFTVAPCTWGQNKIANASIVSILRANETRSNGDDSSSTGISTGAIAGIVVGVVLLLIALLVGILFYLRRKRRTKRHAAELEAKSLAEKNDADGASKPFISAPIGGELGTDSEIHELTAPHKPHAQELDSPYRMDPNKHGYSEMEGGFFGPEGKGPVGAAEVHGDTPVYEMAGSDVHEMPAADVRPGEQK